VAELEMGKMKRIGHLWAIVLSLIVLGALPGRAQTDPAQVPAPPADNALTVPSGQKFIMQLETPLHTRTTRKGDRVEFSTAADIQVDNKTVIPDKSRVRGTVTSAKRAGRLAGRAEIHFRFDEISLADGTVVPLRAILLRIGFDPVEPSDGKDPGLKGDPGEGGDAKAIAKGGMEGAVIGVLSAGPKGAMYGAAAGVAIAAISTIFRRGPDLDLPRSTMLEAQFEQPLSIPAAAMPRPAPAASSPPPETSAAVPVVEEQTSPPRPRLTRPNRDEPPPVENPPAAKPTENPPVAQPTENPPAAKPPENPPAAPTAPAPGPAEKQPAAAGGYKLSVSVRMVLVDTVVRDRQGRLIENLTRDDFLVYEDGVQQEVQNFSRDELPLAVALVIDRSGSVAPYISELRRIAERALAQLKPEDQVALFSFAAGVERVEDLTKDRQRIADGIARVRAGGGTNIVDALHDSVAYLARVAPDHRHAIILISDNQATVQPQASEGETIRKAVESETVVYSIRTSGQGAPLTMPLPSIFTGAGSVSKVVRDTGGEIIDARTVASLDTALASVIQRLRMRYSLGYYPSNPVQGVYHAIVVRLSDSHGKPGSDYFLHARRGYYATADRKNP
jgi:Ca-activated chloride channel family protein